MEIKFPKIINYSIQTVVNLCKVYKRLVFVCVLGLFFIGLPEVWSTVRFEMDPGKIATAETRMWQAYYANDHIALRQELTNLLRNQFDISGSDADEIGELLMVAAMKFESAKSNYRAIVLPDLEHAYSRLKGVLDVEFDPKEAAEAELDWWVARRTPGRDSVEEVGRLIAHLYVVLFGEDQPAFERAGLLRAQAAHIRDEGGASCDWDMVNRLLHESYHALQEGLTLVSNSSSGQVTLSWDPNTENNVVGYKIHYGSSSKNYATFADVGSRTSYTIQDLEVGRMYYFVVTAYYASGIESGYSAEVSHKATVNSSGQVTLSWEPNTEVNTIGYKIYYGKSSGNYGLHDDVGNQTNYTIKGLEVDKTYYFAVTAYNTSGIESDLSAEVSHKATVGITSPSLSQEPVEESALHNAEKSKLQETKVSHQKTEIVWLPQSVDLTKYTKEPFTVKIRVEGVSNQMTPQIFPRIIYYIGTGNSYGYFDMKYEGDGVWLFDIPDPKWSRYRSNSLHYRVKLFDEKGHVIEQSRWKIELIDSFIRQN